MLYLLYGLYEWLNHLPKKFVSFVKKEKDKEKRNVNEDFKGDYAKFYYWINSKGPIKYLHFLDSMREASTGFLYGSETLLAVIGLSGLIFGGFLGFSLPYFWWWFAISLVFL